MNYPRLGSDTSRSKPNILSDAPVILKVTKTPSTELALSNLLIVSPEDFPKNVRYVILNEKYAFTIRMERGFPKGCIGTSIYHRKWAMLSLGQEVLIHSYDPFETLDIYLSNLMIEVSFHSKKVETKETFQIDDMIHIFKKNYDGQIFSKGQLLAFDFQTYNLQVEVIHLEVVQLQDLNEKRMQGKFMDRGILMQHTNLDIVKAPDSAIRLKGNAKQSIQKNIIQPNFKFEDLGIGGLDQEFNSIFRRAFASRIFPPNLIEKLGIQHVKGILLYGPPGTGKTLLARQIGKMLNSREPLIVNGPEILNKFVGQSEENIRKLFSEAEKEYKEKGDDSQLHIIIFDEMDAVFKQRGSRSDGTGVGDSVVNQLLAKMEGVDQLNNILIIGMTNRLDMIDEALLRPGRFEVHMEIGLPDQTGRLQILTIHTSQMRKNQLMDSDVNLEELAYLTKNFSGAEISGLVKSATSFSFNRHIKTGTLAGVELDVEDKMKITRNDFLLALEEVHPAFGVSEIELNQYLRYGIVEFNSYMTELLKNGRMFINQLNQSQKTQLISVLLHGDPSSGKTALASHLALSSEFPFIKLISSENMIGLSETQKINSIHKVFNDAYKSPQSVIVIDGIERIIDWVPIGPRFSNNVLQALMVLLKKTPPKDRKLMVFVTTSHRGILQQMDMLENFNWELQIPLIESPKALIHVLKETLADSNQDWRKLLETLEEIHLTKPIEIGIKKFLNLIEISQQFSNPMERIIEYFQKI